MRSPLFRFTLLALALVTLLSCFSCRKTPSDPFDPESSKYKDASLWSFCETGKDAPADTFFLAPTSVSGDFRNFPTGDADLAATFTLQVGNQKGIYDDGTRFFAPLYAQMTLPCYGMSAEERAPYEEIAYADVLEAFDYYLHCWNGGRPIVLAGSSQGAQMLLRLLKDRFAGELADRLICCYAIGWRITAEDLEALPGLHFASGETDTHCVVSFNSEAPDVASSLIVGADETTLCINPLSWTTSGEEAPAALNLGCCIYSTKGYQKGEDLVGFCGAYIDGKRGTLKVTGVEAQDPDGTLYPSRIDGQPYGVYHIYDWEFFYRNLEKNVTDRVAAYLEGTGK